MIRIRKVAAALAALCVALCVTGALAQSAPPPEAMAEQPDPHDFVTRTETRLNAVGNQLRFGGLGLNTLLMRASPNPQVPTEYETKDLIETAQALGIGLARSVSMGASAGCADCVMPERGQVNQAALHRMDHVLKLAHDAGIRLIIPLAGGRDSCAAATVLNPVADTACIFAKWRGLTPGAFYTNATVRADFTAYVTAILQHVNSETGIAYVNDSTIVGWENCDGCGRDTDAAAIADWTEALGRTIKSIDTHHLYENGAFAGRLTQVGAARLALPSVDVLGDRIVGQPDAGPTRFTAALDEVTNAGRAYVIDSYDWSAATWRTPDDLQAFMDAMRHDRRLTGAFVSDVYGHAQQGGFAPAPTTGLPPLYFPGFAIAGMDAGDVQNRARVVRRFSYRMLDLNPIAYAKPDPPEIISVLHGKVTWRGSAGTLVYSVARSSDPTAWDSWTPLCDKCVSDTGFQWQDNAVPAGSVWYRVTPFNLNMHEGFPSPPVMNR